MVGFKKRPRNARGRHTKAFCFNCSKRPTAEECMEHRWILPTDHLVKKRERAVFLGNRLKVRTGVTLQTTQAQQSQLLVKSKKIRVLLLICV
jgi:hypothetical protein